MPEHFCVDAIEHAHYSPYGSGRVPLSLGYCGYYSDIALAGYWMGNGYRVYSTSLMRFLSPDRPSPFVAGLWNAYSYCAGDPVNHSDHSGFQRSPLIAPKFVGPSRFKVKTSASLDMRKIPIAASRERRRSLPGLSTLKPPAVGPAHTAELFRKRRNSWTYAEEPGVASASVKSHAGAQISLSPLQEYAWRSSLFAHTAHAGWDIYSTGTYRYESYMHNLGELIRLGDDILFAVDVHQLPSSVLTTEVRRYQWSARNLYIRSAERRPYRLGILGSV